MSEDTNEGFLKTLNTVVMKTRELGTDSLSEATLATRLTPMVLIDSALTRADDNNLHNILQTMSGIYAAHYMQAVTIANVESIRTTHYLDKFATTPKRLSEGSVDKWAGRMEAVSEGTQGFIENGALLPTYGLQKVKEPALDEHVNLAVGRQIVVRVGIGENSVELPVTLQLMPQIIHTDALPNVLAQITDDRSYKGRYHKYRAGEIENWVDYAFGLDLIDQDKKLLLSDETGLYATAREKQTRGWIATLTSGQKTINIASAMAIMDKNSQDALQMALGGKLKRARVREKYFVETMSMMLVMVDTLMQSVTIYQRGIAEAGTYTFKDIEKASRNANGMDLTAVLQAYKMGDAPSL